MNLQRIIAVPSYHVNLCRPQWLNKFAKDIWSYSSEQSTVPHHPSQGSPLASDICLPHLRPTVHRHLIDNRCL